MPHEFEDRFHEKGEYVLEVVRTPASVGRRSLVGSYVSIEDNAVFKVTAWDNSRMLDMHYVVEFDDGRTSRIEDAHLSDAVRGGRLRNVKFRTIPFDTFIELLTNAADSVLGYIVDDIEERGGKRSLKKEDEADLARIENLLSVLGADAGDPVAMIEGLRLALSEFARTEREAADMAPRTNRRVIERAAERRARAGWIGSVVDAKASAPPNPVGRTRATARLDEASPNAIRPRG